MSEVVVLKAVRTNKILPPGYELDHDPDVGTLRRLDGAVVAYFPMWSFEPSAALQAAKEDLASISQGKRRASPQKPTSRA